MRAAVSAIAAYRGAAGIGRYAASVARSLVVYGQSWELLLLAREGSEFEGERLPAHVTLVPCRPTGPMWEQLQVPGILERHGADVYHSPLFMAPAVRACRQIVTIHDVIPDRFPEQTPPDYLEFYKRYGPASLRAADAVLTVSEHSRRDILSALPVKDRQVHVAYQAISERFNRGAAVSAACAVRRKLGLPDRFVLYVGSIEPRKRVRELMDAFAEALKARRELCLVLAGRLLFPDYDPRAHAARKGIADRVKCLGYVADEDLPGLYGAAGLLAFPSAYEGFGLPVAEALACGCPVVAAPNSSLPEAGGEAAVYAEPEDPNAFAEAMLRLLEDEGERERRIALGQEHAGRFTGERFAERLLSVYGLVVEGD